MTLKRTGTEVQSLLHFGRAGTVDQSHDALLYWQNSTMATERPINSNQEAMFLYFV